MAQCGGWKIQKQKVTGKEHMLGSSEYLNPTHKYYHQPSTNKTQLPATHPPPPKSTPSPTWSWHHQQFPSPRKGASHPTERCPSKVNPSLCCLTTLQPAQLHHRPRPDGFFQKTSMLCLFKEKQWSLPLGFPKKRTAIKGCEMKMGLGVCLGWWFGWSL